MLQSPSGGAPEVAESERSGIAVAKGFSENDDISSSKSEGTMAPGIRRLGAGTTLFTGRWSQHLDCPERTGSRIKGKSDDATARTKWPDGGVISRAKPWMVMTLLTVLNAGKRFWPDRLAHTYGRRQTGR